MLNYVNCWDLDETLGRFIRLHHDYFEKQYDPEDPPIDVVRSGIRELLKKEEEQGNINYIATSGDLGYAKYVLKKAGLFESCEGRIFGVYDGGKGGKLYLPIAKHAGIEPEEAPKRMIVYGDSPGDIPVDLTKIVFIRHINAYKYDAFVAQQIFDALREQGDGDYSRGFQSLYDQAKIVPHKTGDFCYEQREFDFGNGIKIEVTNDKTADRIEVPSIVVVDAKKYIKDPELILFD